MNNYKENYIYDLRTKYYKKLNTFYKKYGKTEVSRLLVALEIIETENRIILWRICEYLILFNIYIIHLCRGTPIINLSIGKFQIKLEHLLNVIKIEYLKSERKLYPNKKITPYQFIKLIQISNKYFTLESVLKRWFPHYNFDQISINELEEITFAYSGNNEWRDEINYFYVLRNLYLNI